MQGVLWEVALCTSHPLPVPAPDDLHLPQLHVPSSSSQPTVPLKARQGDRNLPEPSSSTSPSTMAWGRPVDSLVRSTLSSFSSHLTRSRATTHSSYCLSHPCGHFRLSTAKLYSKGDVQYCTEVRCFVHCGTSSSAGYLNTQRLGARQQGSAQWRLLCRLTG